MFKNLKSLFIIEEEEDPKPGKAQSEKPQQKKPPVTEGGPQIAESKAGEPGKVTRKFMDVLLKAMEKQNIEGFDYLEYKQSLASLAKMPMDEPTRYRSAFAMAQTMGAKPAHLMQTVQHYMDVLKTEEDKFEQALAAQTQKQVGDKKVKIKDLEVVIKNKAEKIKALTKEIEGHQQQVGQLQKQIKEASVKGETTKNDFIASYNALVTQINTDLENLKKYLK
eukprot:TRINITY_DN38103_c0_g1_i1.p1 TRINITY_DN38103_c0_g1~~TRINITY_DN38103_c0_g1_i1.p1  ORF type:complete len:222 (-),score=40.42 TRINITY_DN38103_c0_g1_i1:26-691(-)